MELSPGKRLGPYELTSRLGAGGMGEVFRARDTRLDRSVAVKVLPTEFGSNTTLKLRFEREARTISQLNHPSICTLHDIGSQDGIEYLVMELVEGETLADRLSRGPLPVGEVLKYGMQVAEALSAAHRAGIVHRDVKPGNIMLAKSGAKLLDFGLARSESVLGVPASSVSEASKTIQKPLTTEGTIIGTFQYMAPEQLEGTEADARTDIFSLGVVLYEMVTGRRAFEGKTRTSLIAAIVGGEPRPINQLQPMTPPALEHLIMRCLEKDREDRWQSAHDVASELAWIRQSLSSGAMPAVDTAKPKRRLAPWLWLGVVALAAIGGLVAGRSLKAPDQTSRPLRAAILPPEDAKFGFLLPSLTISPDGKKMTYVSGDGSKGLWLRSLETGESRLLAGTSGASFPFWSPDSNQLAFFANGKLKMVDLGGAPPVDLADAPMGRSGAWNGDGVILFSPNANTGIYRVSATGGAATPLTTPKEKENETTHRWATFLPDGEHFLYSAGTHNAEMRSNVNAIYVSSLSEPSKRKLLVRAASQMAYANGHVFYASNGVILSQPFNPKRLEVSGQPKMIAPSVVVDPGYFRGVFAVAGDGTIVYRSDNRGGRSVLEWFIPERGARQPLPLAAERYETFDLAPDEMRIAAIIQDVQTGFTDLWLIDLQRGSRTRLTTTKDGFEGAPVWSRDGRQIAFTRGRAFAARGSVFVMNADGSGERPLSDLNVKMGSGMDATSWSPDGRFIAATYIHGDKYVGNERDSDLWLLPTTGEKPRPFLATDTREFGAEFSPSGKWIAYASNESGQMEVYAVRFPQGDRKTQISVGGGTIGAWIGNRIIYGHGARGDNHTIEVIEQEDSLQLGAVQKLPAIPGAVFGDLVNFGRLLIAVHPENVQDDTISIITAASGR